MSAAPIGPARDFVERQLLPALGDAPDGGLALHRAVITALFKDDVHTACGCEEISRELTEWALRLGLRALDRAVRTRFYEPDIAAFDAAISGIVAEIRAEMLAAIEERTENKRKNTFIWRVWGAS